MELHPRNGFWGRFVVSRHPFSHRQNLPWRLTGKPQGGENAVPTEIEQAPSAGFLMDSMVAGAFGDARERAGHRDAADVSQFTALEIAFHGMRAGMMNKAGGMNQGSSMRASRVEHSASFDRSGRERFFAQHPFALFQGPDRPFGVQGRGQSDVDGIDIG